MSLFRHAPILSRGSRPFYYGICPRGVADPLAGVALDGRWQSHKGNNVPWGFYTDPAGTVPAVEWDAVGSWKDQLSGSGLLITQSNLDKRSMLIFDDNGHPCLELDGVDDVLNVAAAATSGATALTAFVLFSQSAIPPLANNASGILDNWGTASAEDHLPWNSGLIYHGFGSTARKVNGSGFSESMTDPCVATFISGPGDWRLYLNSTLTFSTASNTVGIGAAPKVGGNDGLFPDGTSSGVTTTYGAVRVYAVMCMKRVATTPERELIVSYISSLAQ